MSGLWLPPGASPPARATVPVGDLKLADGRRLLRQTNLRGGGGAQVGAWWQCRDGLKVLATMDRTPHGDLLHVSLSYADRDPSWADIRQVRDVFFPATVDAMMLLPRAEDYVNQHEHCFHLWQTPTVWGIQ